MWLPTLVWAAFFWTSVRSVSEKISIHGLAAEEKSAMSIWPNYDISMALPNSIRQPTFVKIFKYDGGTMSLEVLHSIASKHHNWLVGKEGLAAAHYETDRGPCFPRSGTRRPKWSS